MSRSLKKLPILILILAVDDLASEMYSCCYKVQFEDPAAHGHWCTFTDLYHTIPYTIRSKRGMVWYGMYTIPYHDKQS